MPVTPDGPPAAGSARPDGAPPGAGPVDVDLPARRRLWRAWYVYDWANSGYVTVTGTVLFGPYLTVVAKRAACPDQDTALPCGTEVSVLGLPVAPGSLALYAVTAATLISAVLLPVVGAAADRSGRKRALLGATAWTGATAAALMSLVSGTNWQLAVLLLLVANVALGSSLVVYDALLCDIAEPDERDTVSSRGWAMGYLGGGLLLVAALVLVSAPGSVGLGAEAAVRISLLGAGLWWAGWTLVPVLGLRRAGPATGVRGPADRTRPGAGDAFAQLARTLRDLRRYPRTLRFLLAYLFYNDGIQTVIYAASIYGAEQLGLVQQQLIVTILVVQFVAFGGALLFGRIAARTGARRAVLVGLALWGAVVTIGYGLPVGAFLPFLALAVLIGLVLGGTQALSRSLFSQLVPRGREAEYFSLYQAAERGTSWFGTLAFGLVFQVTGSYRNAILALILFFAVGAAILARVDVRRGIEDAGNIPPAVV